MTRIPYGTIPAGTHCEVKRAAEPDGKEFCPIIFDLEKKTMIIASLDSREGRWNVGVPAHLMPDGKGGNMLVATAMTRIVDHGSFAPHVEALETDHLNHLCRVDFGVPPKLRPLHLTGRRPGQHRCGRAAGARAIGGRPADRQ